MRGKHEIAEVIPSAARTATFNQECGNWPANYDEVVGYLNVTASSGTSETLDINYQTSPDKGTTWYTHTSMTQATGATTERKVFTRPAGLRARLLCTIGGTSPSFTFTFHLEGKKDGD